MVLNIFILGVTILSGLAVQTKLLALPLNLFIIYLILIDKNNKITIDNLNDEEGIKQLKEIRFLDDEKGKEQKKTYRIRMEEL